MVWCWWWRCAGDENKLSYNEQCLKNVPSSCLHLGLDIITSHVEESQVSAWKHKQSRRTEKVHNEANTKPVSRTKSISWSDSHPEIQLLPSRLVWLPQRSIHSPDSSSPNLTRSLNFLCWKKCWGMESMKQCMYNIHVSHVSHILILVYTKVCISRCPYLIYICTLDLWFFTFLDVHKKPPWRAYTLYTNVYNSILDDLFLLTYKRTTGGQHLKLRSRFRRIECKCQK